MQALSLKYHIYRLIEKMPKNMINTTSVNQINYVTSAHIR